MKENKDNLEMKKFYLNTKCLLFIFSVVFMNVNDRINNHFIIKKRKKKMKRRKSKNEREKKKRMECHHRVDSVEFDSNLSSTLAL